MRLLRAATTAVAFGVLATAGFSLAGCDSPSTVVEKGTIDGINPGPGTNNCSFTGHNPSIKSGPLPRTGSKTAIYGPDVCRDGVLGDYTITHDGTLTIQFKVIYHLTEQGSGSKCTAALVPADTNPDWPKIPVLCGKYPKGKPVSVDQHASGKPIKQTNR